MSPRNKPTVTSSKPKRRTETLTMSRKRLIMEYKIQSLETQSRCQNSNVRNLLMSNKWINDLYNFMRARDAKISLSDVHRWTTNHAWIRETNGKPKNMGKLPTPQDNNHNEINKHVDSIQTTPHQPLQIKEKYLRSKPTSNSTYVQNYRLARQDSNESLAMPILTPNGSPITNVLEKTNGNFGHMHISDGIRTSSIPKKRLVFREGLLVGETNINQETHPTVVSPANDAGNFTSIEKTQLATEEHELAGFQHVSDVSPDDAQLKSSGLNQDYSPIATNGFDNSAELNTQAMDAGPQIQVGEQMPQGENNTSNGQSTYSGPSHFSTTDETRTNFQSVNACSSASEVASYSSFESLPFIEKLRKVICTVETTAFLQETQLEGHGLLPHQMDFHMKLILQGIRTICREYGEGLMDRERMVRVVANAERIYNRVMRRLLLPRTHRVALKKFLVSFKKECGNNDNLSEDDCDDNSQYNSDCDLMHDEYSQVAFSNNDTVSSLQDTNFAGSLVASMPTQTLPV